MTLHNFALYVTVCAYMYVCMYCCASGYEIELLYLVSDDYPSKAPTLSVPEHLEKLGLKEHVLSNTPLELGSPMLFDLVSTAKEWASSRSLCLPPPQPSSASPSGPSDTTGAKAKNTGSVCSFYLQGKCRFGGKCKKLHPGGSTQATASGQTPQQKQQEEQKSSSDSAEGKKAPMRQAIDVISRILWDPDLPSEDFTIGYLDRFVGVMEKPFSAFSWEDISTVGANVLAIPKHRIQYFKYKEEIVWDKRCQLDNFFGSRGGKVIQELVAAGAVKSQQQPNASEPQDVVTELHFDEIDAQHDSHLQTKYSDRPTHFVCLHITDENVKRNVRKIQDHLLSHTPQLSEGCLPVNALHVTLCMVQLKKEEDIEKAKALMGRIRKQFILILPCCLQLTISGVDNFHERLVYARVVPDPALERFVSFILEQFQLAGLKVPGNHEQYTPHVTIAKLSRSMARELHSSAISSASYLPFKEMFLGMQRIDMLHLCFVGKPKEVDGFYETVASISNSLSGLPPVFRTLLKKRMSLLAEQGVITEHRVCHLVKAVENTHPEAPTQEFDSVIAELLSEENMTCKLPSASANQPTVVILRGLPGSGKSFLAHCCTEALQNPAAVSICSADSYFMEGERYKFNPSSLPQAHSYCLELFLDALGSGKELIVIDNTNSKLWEYRLYIYLCELLGHTYHILETPCPNELLSAKFCSRNVHNVDQLAISRMCQRWEVDERAVFVPPAVGFPRANLLQPPQFSLLSLCLSANNSLDIANLDSFETIKAVYVGVFLTTESQWKLLSEFGPTHPMLHSSHVTLHHESSKSELLALQNKVGKKVQLKVTGSFFTDKVQGVAVQLPRGVLSQNKNPHVTISTNEGVPPSHSNTFLSSQLPMSLREPFVLVGTIGVMVREGCQRDTDSSGEQTVIDDEVPQLKVCVTSRSLFKKFVAPKLLDLPTATDASTSDQTSCENRWQIFPSLQKTTELYLFDFDCTLFDSPNPVAGKALYEKYSGQPWPHRGWLKHPESLLPPIKTTPCPAIKDFRDHLHRAGSLTFVLTGRQQSTKKAVREVLENAHMYPQRIICKPNDSDEKTSVFKCRVFKQLLNEFPDVTLVKFWDDNASNLASMRSLSKSFHQNVEVEIIDVTATTYNKKDPVLPSLSALEKYLQSYAYLPSGDYQESARAGIHFLREEHCKVIGFTGESSLLCYTFGSFLCGRRSDVDICLLLPPSLAPRDHMEAFAHHLESCGVQYVHVGHSSRCPRLKVMLSFSTTSSINFDIVFATIKDDDLFTSLPDKRPSVTEVASWLKHGDAVSKTAFSGPLFQNKVEEIVKGVIPMSKFGAVVEMVVRLLSAHRQKGNAYHCIRTFHIVNLLAGFIKDHHSELPKDLTCDDLFKQFLECVTLLPAEKWQSVVKDFVPAEFIPKVIDVLSRALRDLAAEDCCSIATYEEMVDRFPFPPQGYNTVELSLGGTDAVSLWKLNSTVEARLPTYTRQLLRAGLDVIPNGSSKDGNFIFAVNDSKSTSQTLQSTLRPFWNEIEEFRKQSGVTVELKMGPGRGQSDDKSPEKGTLSSAMEAVMRQIEEFASSSSSDSKAELTLKSLQSKHERMLVYETAERLGLKHNTISFGKKKDIKLTKE